MPGVAERHRCGFSRVSGKLLVDSVGLVEPIAVRVAAPAARAGAERAPGGRDRRATGRRWCSCTASSATRRNVVQGSRSCRARLPRDRLRRPRPRRAPPPGARPTSTPTWCDDLEARAGRPAASSGRCWWAARWAPPPRWRSRCAIPSGSRRWCRSRPPSTARRARATSTGALGRGWPTGSRRAAWTGSWMARARRRCPSAGASRPCARPCASGWSATSTRDAVADALRVVPRSAAFDGLEALDAARDAGAGRRRPATSPTRCTRWRSPRSTRGLPQRRAASWRTRASRPLAWQGAQLSRAIADFLGAWAGLLSRRARCRGARSSRPPATATS